jgi:hypothetical protein
VSSGEEPARAEDPRFSPGMEIGSEEEGTGSRLQRSHAGAQHAAGDATRYAPPGSLL